jgi:hypothetical protein
MPLMLSQQAPSPLTACPASAGVVHASAGVVHARAGVVHASAGFAHTLQIANTSPFTGQLSRIFAQNPRIVSVLMVR